MVVWAQTDSLSLMVGISSSFISVSSMPCAVWLGFEKPKKKETPVCQLCFCKDGAYRIFIRKSIFMKLILCLANAQSFSFLLFLL